MRVVLLVGALLGKASCGRCTEAESQLWQNEHSFTQKINKCAIRHLGAVDATATCIRGGLSLSAPCARCFGEATDCGREHCISDCLADTASEECIRCTTDSGCAAALDACTGFSGPPVPTHSPPGAALDAS